MARSYVCQMNTTAVHPSLTIQSASGEFGVLRRAWYSKQGFSNTATAVERVSVGRSNSNGVTPTDRTEKDNTRSPTNTVLGQSWGTAPTTSGNPIVFTDCGNKPTHQNSWRPARPWAGIYLVNAEEVYIDANSAANNSCQYTLSWSENDTGIEDRTIRGRRLLRPGLWHYHNHNHCMWVGSTTNPRRALRQNWCGWAGKRFDSHISMNTLLLGSGAPPGTAFPDPARRSRLALLTAR